LPERLPGPVEHSHQGDQDNRTPRHPHRDEQQRRHVLQSDLGGDKGRTPEQDKQERG
jgi:hypothetical protein